MSAAQKSVNRLQQISLSWDYWDLAEKTEAGEGAIANLKAVPDTFSNIQVCAESLICLKA